MKFTLEARPEKLELQGGSVLRLSQKYSTVAGPMVDEIDHVLVFQTISGGHSTFKIRTNDAIGELMPVS